MRQVGNTKFPQLLNRCREGKISDDDAGILKKRIVSSNSSNYPNNALHIWAENVHVERHNAERLNMIHGPCVTLSAKDQFPEKTGTCLPKTLPSHSRGDNNG